MQPLGGVLLVNDFLKSYEVKEFAFEVLDVISVGKKSGHTEVLVGSIYARLFGE